MGTIRATPGRRDMRYLLCALALSVSMTAASEEVKSGYPPEAPEGARTEVYREVDGVKLQAYIFEQTPATPSLKRPAVVFFFGGGWSGGSPTQFFPHCRYFATRGMVAMAVDYRVASRQDARIVDCIDDALGAMRWVHAHAARLGIDPDRVVASGGSAGGHLAACAALSNPRGEESNDEARPAVLALFNPVLLLAPIKGLELDPSKYERLARRAGGPPEKVSPIHLLKGSLPPTIIFHGESDDTVPIVTIDAFAKAAPADSTVVVERYPGKEHGFFNFGRKDKKAFVDTVTKMDRFLSAQGIVSGDPAVEAFVASETSKP